MPMSNDIIRYSLCFSLALSITIIYNICHGDNDVFLKIFRVLFEYVSHNVDNKEMKQQVKELQTRVDSLTSEKFDAEKRAAVAEAKFEQLITSPIKK